MIDYERRQLRIEADDLEDKILKHFRRRGVDCNIVGTRILRGRFIYEIKLKGTSEEQIHKHASSVRLALKLPVFIIFRVGLTVYIAVSKHEIVHPRLPKVLSSKAFKEARRNMKLPYPVGFNAMGELVIVDLADFPHLLSGGATLSGKTVGLQSLVLSIISSKSVDKVNLIIIDAGAGDLEQFDGVPHLSCPIVSDMADIDLCIWGLEEELKRRIKLKGTKEYSLLPSIVCVIDEFPALISSIRSKEILNRVTGTISSLLQRGRHAKIHLVLAAQNPTQKSLHIDLGNFTARMAFKCAKFNNSVTILGQSGAENLLGKGDMLFMSPQHENLMRLQGVFISPSELRRAISDIEIRASWMLNEPDYHEYKFVIDDSTRERMIEEQVNSTLGSSNTPKENANEKKFAGVTFWVLRSETVSCNQICNKFKVSWRTANKFLEMLHSAGIVDSLDAKLPRKVIPVCVDDLSTNTIKFLESHGFDANAINTALEARNGGGQQWL